jgi:hypothetical protein
MGHSHSGADQLGDHQQQLVVRELAASFPAQINNYCHRCDRRISYNMDEIHECIVNLHAIEINRREPQNCLANSSCHRNLSSQSSAAGIDANMNSGHMFPDRSSEGNHSLFRRVKVGSQGSHRVNSPTMVWRFISARTHEEKINRPSDGRLEFL